MKTKIGTIKLNKTQEFIQYSEYSAWTDYVTCEPQEVDLFTDSYWIFMSCDGILTRSTFPSSARNIGQPAKACSQTQACGGIGHWADRITLLPAYTIEQVGTYGEGCGQSTGKPVVALRKAEFGVTYCATIQADEIFA